jgi:hypothetical protein
MYNRLPSIAICDDHYLTAVGVVTLLKAFDEMVPP